MNRNVSMEVCRIITLVIATLVSQMGLEAASSTPPNVVLIFADDLGYGDVGCYGATKVQTPNIDRLAKEGRRFTDAHSVSAVCTPSRYALLTGEYPLRGNGGRGVWGPAPITSPLLINTEQLTVADVLKNSGYDTAVLGKWHLGFGEGRNNWKEPLRPGPQDLGFDYYFGMPVVNSAPPYVYVENDRVVGGDPADPLVHLGRNKKGVTPITPIPPEAAQRSPNQFGGAKKAHKLYNDYQVGTKFAEKSVEWIKARKNKPFFLYLATTNIHHPFTPAKRFQGTSQCGLYGDYIHELDWMVGEILMCLEDNGLSDNTLVIFTSDNGGMFNRGGQAAFKRGHKLNGDLLGFKFGVWEGGHRVPFIVRWPEKVKAGTTSNQLIGHVDMLATIAAATGQKLDKAQQGDSVNMLPAFVGEPDKPIRDHLILAPHKGTHLSVRKGKWMYIPRQGSGGFGGRNPGDHGFAGPPAANFIGSVNSDFEDGKYKKDAPPAQLYDLENDVNQTRNLFREHPDVVKELSALLQSYRASKPSPRTPAKPPKPAPVQRPVKTKYDGFKPLGALRFTFESGKLDGWSIVEGESGRPVSGDTSLPRHKSRPFNRQGKFHLSTIATADGVADKQQVVFQSPVFVIRGNKASFLASGGFDRTSLYVGLFDAESKKVLLTAGGPRGPQMKRTTWDVSRFKGKPVFLRVVDKNIDGWGHLTFDDFSVDGELVDR